MKEPEIVEPTTPLPEPIRYEGWAPCFHGKKKTDEEWTAAREQWLKDLSPSSWWGAPNASKMFLGGADAKVDIVEKLLWELSVQKTVTCNADQWVGVTVKGGEPCTAPGPVIDYGEPGFCNHDEWPLCREIVTYIQGDDYTLALAESYRWWREREKLVA